MKTCKHFTKKIRRHEIKKEGKEILWKKVESKEERWVTGKCKLKGLCLEISNR